MKITEALIAEHVVFHNLFDYIERALPRMKTLGEVKLMAGLLESALAAHAKAEDELILAPLEHCLAQMGHQEKFHHEHDEIDRNLNAIHAARDLAKARKLLRNAVDFSRKHFDSEERILFPIAEEALKPDTLTALASSWKKQREVDPL